MKIQSFDKSIKNIFGSNYYKIPRFQRPYSWDRDNVEEFWQDAVLESDEDYFIGSIVVFKSDEDDIYGIVDGQQRLTTITMILCALRNSFRKHDLESLSKGVHALIERKDINDKKQFILQTETSYPYLQENIQKETPAEVHAKIAEEERLLGEAFLFISNKIEETISELPKGKQKKERVRKFLTDIRDKILALKTIFIELENEEDAYMIFETLNTRGKDLRSTDLIKNHISKLYKSSNPKVDHAKLQWNQMLGILEESEEEINSDTFLHYYWLSTGEYTTLKKLYKQVRKEIKTESDAKLFLKNVLRDGVTFRELNEPSARKWHRNEVELKQTLDAINIFKVKQSTPMFLSVLREHKLGRLKFKHALEILHAIENFHFLFTAITFQRSSGGISFMYAKSARNLYLASDNAKKIEVVRDLKFKLKKRIPAYKEFELKFNDVGYSNKNTKQKKLVQYLLSKIDRHIATSGISVDYENMTIEHILPQSDKAGGKYSEMIGNLILVDSKLNGKLDDKPFAQKKEMMKKSGYLMDAYIAQAKEWGPKQIQERTRLLANMAYHKIWKIQI